MGKRLFMQIVGRCFAQGVALLACALFLLSLMPAFAHADELSAVKEEISAKVEELENLGQEVDQAKEQITKLDGKIQQTLREIDEKQAEHANLQASTSQMAIELYKDSEAFDLFAILENSTSVNELMRHLEMNDRVLEAYGDAVERTALAREALNEKYRQVSSEKDEQVQLTADLQEKAVKLKKSIASLRSKESLLTLEQQAVLAQASAAAKEVAQTFDTDAFGKVKIKWKTGLTTAYGGTSDKNTPLEELTATGTECDDWSVGVAVPLAWGPEKYYGRYVEISYEGKSIIAPVVDCGYMGNGYVSFDLQPGVFKAFGCKDCDEWGVREVRYRFL